MPRQLLQRIFRRTRGTQGHFAPAACQRPASHRSLRTTTEQRAGEQQAASSRRAATSCRQRPPAAPQSLARHAAAGGETGGGSESCGAVRASFQAGIEVRIAT
eukprot:scaffold164099_cov24-Tisochrysis_lutea.AAC.2